MYETSDFKKGLKLMVDGQPYVIVDFQHVKPGKGNQFSRTKMRSLLTGQNLERTFKSGEKFEVPNVENVEMTFLYKDDNGFNFMNQTNFEQLCMMDHEIGDAKNYLTENLVVVITLYNEKAVVVDVPNAVNLRVAQTDPGIKGDRVTGATKPATMETGLIVNVPLHINEGDVLRIDTESGDYVERVNQK
ncbi:elongation factor P [Pseudobdellovibrio exovorus]|uniref:Elongation factor P n=1 Tax=Pseudobdellovibrio exovorus JSS TaxID=1184267 RepID=M4V9Q5_9BACT|nr:elongation factor P [Pseudobdellovibrio exovorus]AGH95180.1 translation elongation factor EF-P [Pseudobdellovibrio exovorus JSS]